MGTMISRSPSDSADELQTKRVLEGVAQHMAHLHAIGKRIEVTLTKGDTVVRHGLGRVPEGWLTLSCRPVGDGPPSPVARRDWDAETITFVANADVVFTALIF